MGRVVKYSYDEWLEKAEGKVVCSCGVRFEDGFLGTFVRRRIPTIRYKKYIKLYKLV